MTMKEQMGRIKECITAPRLQDQKPVVKIKGLTTKERWMEGTPVCREKGGFFFIYTRVEKNTAHPFLPFAVLSHFKLLISVAGTIDSSQSNPLLPREGV